LAGAVEALRNEGAKGIVLDLRQNPGGLMDEAIKVADYLLPAGDIIRYEPRFAQPHTYRASGKGLDIPYVLLIDQFSASASEIVAGAVKDRGAAPLVGVKTFGKGIIQSILPLSNGGGLKVTSARYLTPSGIDIHQVGIEPDIVVQPAAGESHGPEAARDPLKNRQMEKAVEELRAEMARRGTRAGSGR
jgi:carboxyl-terminal processing protease